MKVEHHLILTPAAWLCFPFPSFCRVESILYTEPIARDLQYAEPIARDLQGQVAL